MGQIKYLRQCLEKACHIPFTSLLQKEQTVLAKHGNNDVP